MHKQDDQLNSPKQAALLTFSASSQSLTSSQGSGVLKLSPAIERIKKSESTENLLSRIDGKVVPAPKPK